MEATIYQSGSIDQGVLMEIRTPHDGGPKVSPACFDAGVLVARRVRSRFVASTCQLGGGGSARTSLLGREDVDRDLDGWRRSSVFEPVQRVPVLGPPHPRPILRSHAVAMICDRSLEDVHDARPIAVVVNRTEDPSRLHGHLTHP